MADHQAAPSINLPEQSTRSCSHPRVPSLLDRKALSTRGFLSRCRLETGSASVPTPRHCGHPVDGALASWQEVEREGEWRELLLGNGLSSHIWPAFAYGSLYARACSSGLLAGGDRELFKANATENFETVLRALAVSIGTLSALGEPAVKGLRKRYLHVQRALGAAVRGVHVPLAQLPASTRRAVRSTLREYRWVFTTNYDLVLYWCAGYGESFDGFADLFFCNDRLEFNPARSALGRDSTGLVYLHGALHLLVDRNGVARKRRSRASTLLAQFGQPDATDSLTRPLLVAEGSAHEKSRIINGNDYLSFGLNQLRRGRCGLVVFGLSLREEDAHLLSALNFGAKRPIAVGIRPGTRTENRRRQARVRALIDAEELFFFDSSTHPLGDQALSPLAPGQRLLASSNGETACTFTDALDHALDCSST